MNTELERVRAARLERLAELAAAYGVSIGHMPEADAGSCTASIRAGVAVAIGQQVVPRSTWAQRLVAPEDEIELFQAIAGG